MGRIYHRGHHERDKLTNWQMEVLQGGFPVLSCPIPFDGAIQWGQSADARTKWRIYRRDIIADFQKHPLNAGRRCWAEWHFDLGMTDEEITAMHRREATCRPGEKQLPVSYRRVSKETIQ